MKNKIIVTIVIIIAFLIAGLLIYANNVLLPIKLKAKIIEELQKNLDKDVQIEKMRYNLFKGIIIQNLVIFDKTKENPYLSVKEISFNFLFLPLFQKQIIIPLLHLESPYIYLTLRQDKTLNIMDILKKWQLAEEKPKYLVSVIKSDISNGRFQFRDERAQPPYTKEVVDLKIGVGINPPDQIRFILQGKILNGQQNPSFISTIGEYKPSAQELQSKTKLANLIVNDYLLYLKNLPFFLSNGTIENADLEINLKDKQLFLKGIINSKSLNLRKEKFVLSGNINIEPDIKYDLQNKYLEYKAGFGLSNAQLMGIDYLKNISNIEGRINLEENRIWSDDLKAQVLDSTFDINGELKDFADVYLKLNASSKQIKLEKFTAIIPDLPTDINISGDSTLNIELKGSLKKPPLEINATSEVISAKIKLPALKEPLNEVKGKIALSGNQLNWKNLSFLYKQTQYNSSGNLVEFKQPEVNFNLSSQELALDTSLNIKDKIIKIKKCSGKYLNSEFAIKGDIDTHDNKNPSINVNLDSNISMNDTLGLLPANVSEDLKKIKPTGFCKVTGSLNGSVNDLRNWNTNLKFSSPSISIYKLTFDNVNFSLQQKNGSLNIKDLTAKPYAGNLSLELLMNLLDETPVYKSKIVISNIDLAKLKMDTQLKDKDISGILSSRLNLEGTTKGLQTLKGQGSLSIKNGRLWELNLFKGLGEFLFIPIYQKIVFKDADANFTIKDKIVEIANSFLGSEKLDLAAEGKIRFDGSLDLTLNSQINENLIKESPDLRKFTSSVLGNILVIKVSGTIQKPEYRLLPSTKEMLKQIRRFFLGK